MTKRIFSIAILLLSITQLFAQSHYDAFLYSESNLLGTARSSGMANAFGALGADMSVLSTNPAGLGVYQSVEFSYSLSLREELIEQAISKEIKSPIASETLMFPLLD